MTLQISEQALGPDRPVIGVRRGSLGSVLQAQGDLAGARDQYERALQISEQALGPDHVWPLWTSVRPGREHDTTCARAHDGLLDALTDRTDEGHAALADWATKARTPG